MDAEYNFVHWQQLAHQEGAALQATTRCTTIKMLEVDAFIREIAIQRPDLSEGGAGLVVEVGCGVGINLLGIQDAYPHLTYLGIDFVQEMVDSAQNLADERLQGRDDLRASISFVQGDVRTFSWPPMDDGFPEYVKDRRPDIVLTDRCLINLQGLDEQVAAIKAIRSALTGDGCFLMLENSVQAAGRLNLGRKSLGADHPGPGSGVARP